MADETIIYITEYMAYSDEELQTPTFTDEVIQTPTYSDESPWKEVNYNTVQGEYIDDIDL